MSNILAELRDVDGAPGALRDIDQKVSVLIQVLARAADEIDRLRAENARLRKYAEGPVVVCGDDEIIARKAEKKAALENKP